MVSLEKLVNISWNDAVDDSSSSLTSRFKFLNTRTSVAGESYNNIFLISDLIKNIKVIIEIFTYIV